MPAAPGATAFLPTSIPAGADDLTALAQAAEHCEGCELFAEATQAVFGEGRTGAPLLFVGEQPGDQEDRAGRPFVGPAGKVFDAALREVGIERQDAYVTNAVKHFRWKPDARGGPRRLHATPSAGQATACRPWLTREIEAVRPRMIVALGATAAKTLFGPAFKLTQQRGQVLDWPPTAGPFAAPDDGTLALGIGPDAPGSAVATIHPSAVLRADDRDEAMSGLVADLRVVAESLGAPNSL